MGGRPFMRCGGEAENAVRLLALAPIAAASLVASVALAQTSPADPSQSAPQSAGLCVRLNEMGQVIDAQVAQTSGDPALDENAVALARTLQWDPPYPKPGWLGVRVTLSNNGPSPTPAGALPHCSAASDSKAGLAI